MIDHHLTDVAADLGITLAEATTLAGSLSGSHVYAVTRADHLRAVLKITTGTDGPAREAAERELHVYLELSDRLGIRVPTLLDHRETGDAIAILLTAHPAPRPAARWTRDQWLALAADLGRLHQTPIPAGHQWRRPSWLAATLDSPDLDTARAFWSQPGEAELLAPILADPQALHEALDVTADCFLHGDCHTDNVLIEQHQLIWTDWQGAGAGTPAAELVFPAIRAIPEGADVPQDAMTRRYAQARGLDAAPLGRAVLAAELAILIFAWPGYAAFNTDIGIQRIRQRVRHRARDWLDV